MKLSSSTGFLGHKHCNDMPWPVPRLWCIILFQQPLATEEAFKRWKCVPTNPSESVRPSLQTTVGCWKRDGSCQKLTLMCRCVCMCVVCVLLKTSFSTLRFRTHFVIVLFIPLHWPNRVRPQCQMLICTRYISYLRVSQKMMLCEKKLGGKAEQQLPVFLKKQTLFWIKKGQKERKYRSYASQQSS